MKATLEVISQMRTDGVIGRYAIGGAVGATFYVEPAATMDIDIFVSFEENADSSLISISPIYEYLTARGHRTQGEYIIIGGWPVQFLPPSDLLGEEALQRAVETEVEGVRTWVMTAEHLVALALETGRAKDHLRILQFIESGVLDVNELDAMLTRHGLLEKWKRFMLRFIEDK